MGRRYGPDEPYGPDGPPGPGPGPGIWQVSDMREAHRIVFEAGKRIDQC